MATDVIQGMMLPSAGSDGLLAEQNLLGALIGWL